MLALAVSGVTGTANADTRLSAQELRWTQAATPVVAYARAQGLPLDVVVQPQDTPGLAPVAMALVDGRCKLVFSMRGNPAAADTERSIPPALFVPVVEAIAAHEMAHCWRQVHGAWRTVPAGFTDASGPANTDPDVAARWADMQVTRREEGFADLVGLAWTWHQHPAKYAQVHAWLMQERADPPLAGSHHDTQAWVRLAANGGFGDADSPFEQVTRMWVAGLANER